MKAPGSFTSTLVTVAELNALGHVYTSGTRPTSNEAYTGRRIYETDTSMWQSYADSAWTGTGPVDGALTDWSGSIRVDQGATNIGRSATLATYSRIGRQIKGMFRVVFNAAGTAGQVIKVTLPVAASTSAAANINVIGSGVFVGDTGTPRYVRPLIAVIGVTASRMQFVAATAAVGTVYFGTGETIASTEVLTCTFAYEAAS